MSNTNLRNIFNTNSNDRGRKPSMPSLGLASYAKRVPNNLTNDATEGDSEGQQDHPETSTDACSNDSETEKRDIKQLLEDCVKNKGFGKKPSTDEEQCCSWHKYVFYALPLALYLPWFKKTVKCPPKCCPPRYCCPDEPICPPPKLSCPPTVTGCKRACPPEPDPCSAQCHPKPQ